MNMKAEEIICNFRESVQDNLSKKIESNSDQTVAAADELIKTIKAWKGGDVEFKEIDEALTKLKIVDSEWHILEDFKEYGDW